MRSVLRMFVASQLLLGTSCLKPQQTAMVGDRTDLVKPPAGRECEISDNPANSNRCINLLPARWDTLKGTALTALGGKIEEMLPRGGEVVQERPASADCLGRSSTASENVTVGYRVPAAAMAVFPTTGTSGRELVIGVMTEKGAAKCSSQRYHVSSRFGSGPRTLSLLTVATEKGEQIPGVNRQVGRWKSWSISSIDGVLTAVNTGSGAFVSCGHSHFTEKDQGGVTHAFVSCENTDRLVQLARARAGKAGRPDDSAEIDKVFAEYRDGNLLNDITDSRFTDSAWSRCGNLGCCAAE